MIYTVISKQPWEYCKVEEYQRLNFECTVPGFKLFKVWFMSAAKKEGSNAAYIQTLAVYIKAFTTSVFADIQTFFECLPKLRSCKHER